jgi:hypothetical protein
MTKPKWKDVYRDIVENEDTIAVEHTDGGLPVFFRPKSGLPVHAMSVKAMLTRGLIRPCGVTIDPAVPQYFEPVTGDDEASIDAGSLRRLKASVNEAREAFLAACSAAGYSDEWEFYRATDQRVGAPSPDVSSALAAFDVYRSALHSFYLVRDGSSGFLGRYDQ